MHDQERHNLLMRKGCCHKQKVWLSSGLYQTRPILWSSDLIHLNVEVAYPFIQLVKQIFASIHL